MKKNFIFLFAAFLVIFMGCSQPTDEPEIPASETIKTDTVDKEEIFEVIALDDDGNTIANIEQINTDLNWPSTSSDPNNPCPKYARYLYKNICINGIKFKADNNIYLQDDERLICEYMLADQGNLLMSDTYIDFIDFYKGISDIIDEDLSIKFSDLYRIDDTNQK